MNRTSEISGRATADGDVATYPAFLAISPLPGQCEAFIEAPISKRTDVEQHVVMAIT